MWIFFKKNTCKIYICSEDIYQFNKLVLKKFLQEKFCPKFLSLVSKKKTKTYIVKRKNTRQHEITKPPTALYDITINTICNYLSLSQNSHGGTPEHFLCSLSYTQSSKICYHQLLFFSKVPKPMHEIRKWVLSLHFFRSIYYPEAPYWS